MARADKSQDHSRALRTCIWHTPKNWKRHLGRPRHTWLRTVEADLHPFNLGLASGFKKHGTELPGAHSRERLRHRQAQNDDDDDVCYVQSGGEGQVSLASDDVITAASQKNGSATLTKVDELADEHCSTSHNAADDVATSTAQRANDSTSPTHIALDDAGDSDRKTQPEVPETPTSQKDDDSTHRSSLFSKRAGVTPPTPPIRESRGRKSPPILEERPKSKGCCVII